MNKTKKLGYIEIVGEVLVVLAALAWMTHHPLVPYVYALGALAMCICRMTSACPEDSLTLSRLYRQRRIASLILVASAALMFVSHSTLVFGTFWIMPSSWLLPFYVFVVVEVYTTFRYAYLTSK